MNVRELKLPEHAVDQAAIADAAAAAYEARVRLYRVERERESMRNALDLFNANIFEPAQFEAHAMLSKLRALLDQVKDDAHVSIVE